MKKIATVFFGTHRFAALILQGLHESPFCDIELVMTQPDRPVGRSQTLQPSPVKLLAQKYGIPVEQPASLKSYRLSASGHQLGVVAQYGLLIPKYLLEVFPHGILNIHTSLLPKYRGASPIQAAIMNGDGATGITIMKLDTGLDTGPVILQKETAIDEHETAPELETRLARLALEALAEAIPAYLSGRMPPRPQAADGVSLTRALTRDDGRVDWKRNAMDIYNQWRALQPWPGLWTLWGEKRLKLLQVAPTEANLPSGLVEKVGNAIVIGCGSHALQVQELQMEGSRPMAAAAFLNGHPYIRGARLE